MSVRRTVSPRSWALLLPALLLAVCACDTRAGRAKRPNVVLMIADDQDSAHLGFEGHALARTPNLDRLAAEGVVFTTLHTPPRCRPSLATLLSGRWPHQSGIYANRHERTLAPERSLPNLLRAAGYATFAGGKYWEGDAAAMGFDAPAEPTRWFVRRGQDELFAFLRERDRDQPFFVWWAPTIPHTPHDPPERHARRFAEADVPLPEWFQGDAALFRDFERTSLAMGAWFDEAVGELVTELERLGEHDDTLYLFLIDNGWSNGRVAKGSPFEQGVRTPLVVRPPMDGRRGAGAWRLDVLASSVDVYPTILDYAGVPLPASAAGVSLRPAIEGRPFEAREVLFGAVFGRTASESEDPADDVYALYARTPRWKYVHYVRPVTPAVWDIMRVRPQAVLERAAGDEDLYDLEHDPLEQHDLADDPAQRERMDELREGAFAWWEATGGEPLR